MGFRAFEVAGFRVNFFTITTQGFWGHIPTDIRYSFPKGSQDAATEATKATEADTPRVDLDSCLGFEGFDCLRATG